MRFALLALVGCGSPPAPAVPAVTGPGVLAGVILDRPGEPAAGATVIAIADGKEQAGIADEQGTYRIELPPGSYHVLAYYADETLELGRHEIRAGATAKADAVLDPLARCAGGRRETQSTQAERDAVTAAMLERFRADRSMLNGHERLPDRAILVELDHGITANALPVHGAIFVPATHATLEDLAARRGAPVPYIRVVDLSFLGECARVELGVSVTGPERNCCSTASEVYELRDGRAVFRQVTTRVLTVTTD